MFCAFGLTNQITHKTHDMLEVKDGSHQPSLFVHHGHSATLEQSFSRLKVVWICQVFTQKDGSVNSDCHITQDQLADLLTFTNQNKMKINTKRTKVIPFNLSKKYYFLPQLNFPNQEPLEVIYKTKLLGVTLSSDLSWSTHILMTSPSRQQRNCGSWSGCFHRTIAVSLLTLCPLYPWICCSWVP